MQAHSIWRYPTARWGSIVVKLSGFSKREQEQDGRRSYGKLPAPRRKYQQSAYCIWGPHCQNLPEPLPGTREDSCDRDGRGLRLTDFRTCICQAVWSFVSLGGFLVEDLIAAHLFSVVDLPDDGFPTKPMRGSRGIVETSWCGLKRPQDEKTSSVRGWECQTDSRKIDAGRKSCSARLREMQSEFAGDDGCALIRSRLFQMTCILLNQMTSSHLHA